MQSDHTTPYDMEYINATTFEANTQAGGGVLVPCSDAGDEHGDEPVEGATLETFATFQVELLQYSVVRLDVGVCIRLAVVDALEGALNPELQLVRPVLPDVLDEPGLRTHLQAWRGQISARHDREGPAQPSTRSSVECESMMQSVHS